MFLRSTTRVKDGKIHYYWSIVENRRCRADRVVQQTVLYLGEINDSQREQWIRAIEVFDEDAGAMDQLKPIFDSQRRCLLGRCSPGAASRAIQVPGPQKCSAISLPKNFFHVALVQDLWLLAVELNSDHVFS